MLYQRLNSLKSDDELLSYIKNLDEDIKNTLIFKLVKEK